MGLEAFSALYEYEDGSWWTGLLWTRKGVTVEPKCSDRSVETSTRMAVLTCAK